MRPPPSPTRRWPRPFRLPAVRAITYRAFGGARRASNIIARSSTSARSQQRGNDGVPPLPLLLLLVSPWHHRACFALLWVGRSIDSFEALTQTPPIHNTTRTGIWRAWRPQQARRQAQAAVAMAAAKAPHHGSSRHRRRGGTTRGPAGGATARGSSRGSSRGKRRRRRMWTRRRSCPPRRRGRRATAT